MKSGVQMNPIERRACADRALAQLVQMVREETETLSSREQGGVYQLESTLVEKSNSESSAVRTRLVGAMAMRWRAFSTVLLVLVRALLARCRMYARSARAHARVTCGWHLARVFVELRVAFARVGAWLHQLRGRARRARSHWLLFVSRRKVG